MQVLIKNRDIKKLARQSMRGKWLRSLLVVALAMVILNAPRFLVYYLTTSQVWDYVLFLYQLFITGPIIMGVITHFLDSFRGVEKPGLESFARGFSNVTAAHLYITVFGLVLFWSLFFVIPGIIALFRYSQSFFILADNPELSARECIEKSKTMMRNMKGRLFALNLSFLGWMILASLPASYVMTQNFHPYGSIVSAEAYISAMQKAAANPAVTVLSMLMCFVWTYLIAANTCFYDLLSGNLRIFKEVPQSDYDAQGVY